MRLQRVRALLIFFLAMFMVNSVAAVTRACTLSQVRHEHSALQLLSAEIDRNCPEAAATLCAIHCVQEAKSAEVKAPADLPPATAMAPLSAASYAGLRPEPARLPVAITHFVVGPRLTILFGHLRN